MVTVLWPELQANMEIQREKKTSAPLNASASNEDVEADSSLPQATYRSFKKKFRKMKLQFDEAIQQNKELFFDEQRAIQTSKRIAFQNDQILDMLYDVNNSTQIPVEKRVDLTCEAPSLSAIPPLVSDNELSKISKLESSQGRLLYQEICDLISTRESSKPSPTSQKSLVQLMATTPHLKSSNPHLPPDLLKSLEPDEGQKAPYSYLTLEQIDEFYQEIDASRSDFLHPPPPQISTKETYQDPVFGNFHSPYNWLRRNVPQIFLQDGEFSEKSGSKPGALRGAGNRANTCAPNKSDVLEILEEDGLGYEFTPGVSKEKEKKRKRDEDHHVQTPKKGSTEENKAKKPRQARKKKTETSDEKVSSSKKSKKLKTTSHPTDAHPLGLA